VQEPLDIPFIMHGIYGTGDKMRNKEKEFFPFFLGVMTTSMFVFFVLYSLDIIASLEDTFGMGILFGGALYNILAFFIKYPMFQRFVSAKTDKNPILRVVILLVSIGLLIIVSMMIYNLPAKD